MPASSGIGEIYVMDPQRAIAFKAAADAARSALNTLGLYEEATSAVNQSQALLGPVYQQAEAADEAAGQPQQGDTGTPGPDSPDGQPAEV